MRILVPIDFSKTAYKALEYALEFFDQSNSTFILFHAFIPFESGFFPYEKLELENDKEEKRIKNNLKKKATKYNLIYSKANIIIKVDRGTAERCILDYIGHNNIDIVVMGTTGATGIKEKLIGSLTAKIMTESPCSVIGVPEKYKPNHISKIAFCSNYELLDINDLKYLIRITGKFKAEIQIWHFITKSDNKAIQNVSQTTYVNLIENLIKGENITFHVSESESISDALEELSNRQDIQLIALRTYHRKGLLNILYDKSLTKKLAYHTKIPLLAIHSEET